MMNRMVLRASWLLASLAATAALIGVWQLTAQFQLVSPVYLPTVSRTVAAMMGGFQDGTLQAQFMGTVWHMIAGWLVASLFGILLGTLIGMSEPVRAYVEPTLEVLRPLPASALVPIAIAIFGLSESMVIGVVAFGAIWPVLLGTIHGLSTVDGRLVEVSRLLALSRFSFVRNIVLPHATPDVIAGMKLSLTISLILTVVGEMLSSTNGMGRWLLLASRSYQSANVFSGVILLGVLGLISSICIDQVERHLLRWRASQ